jgi:hypothetical protein
MKLEVFEDRMYFEAFKDRMYFDQWCVRPEGSSDFNDTIHFIRKIDALLAQKTIEGWIEQEREACIDIVAMYGGSIEIEAAIRARGETK